MHSSTRREFLQSSVIFAAAAFAGSIPAFKHKPLLSFSTLGCPDWAFEKIVDFASTHNYTGIELRGIQHEMDLPVCALFNSAQNRIQTMKIMKDKGLHFVDLGSSANLHFAGLAERKKNLDEAKRFIDLATEIKSPFIRVFPNSFPKDQEKNVTLDLMSKGLLELAAYAKGSGVTVLMETHGDLVKTEDIERVMEAATHPNSGLVWDVANMWTITKEAPAEVYARLKQYVKHTHIKDAKLSGGKIDYVFLGRGEVPIFEAIDVLSKNDYKGYYSFEWEKLWHPEIAEPELAFADYSQVMLTYFDRIGNL
jgi:sugar phosphate isomerase/epimerase